MVWTQRLSCGTFDGTKNVPQFFSPAFRYIFCWLFFHHLRLCFSSFERDGYLDLTPHQSLGLGSPRFVHSSRLRLRHFSSWGFLWTHHAITFVVIRFFLFPFFLPSARSSSLSTSTTCSALCRGSIVSYIVPPLVLSLHLFEWEWEWEWKIEIHVNLFIFHQRRFQIRCGGERQIRNMETNVLASLSNDVSLFRMIPSLDYIVAFVIRLCVFFCLSSSRSFLHHFTQLYSVWLARDLLRQSQQLLRLQTLPNDLLFELSERRKGERQANEMPES